MPAAAVHEAAMWVQKKARTCAYWVLAVLIIGSIGVLVWVKSAHAAIFVVNRTADTPDANLTNAACDVEPSQRGNQCTLRAAIQEANDTPGEDQIRFNIVSAAAVKTISPASALPFITEAVTINGYSQTGANANTLAEGNGAVLRIQLNGTNAGGVNGLVIQAPSCTIRGLVINRFEGNGVLLSGSVATGNEILGNFIGTNAAGTADRGNGMTAWTYQAPTTTRSGERQPAHGT
jgi:CSLREA domain-containing protein